MATTTTTTANLSTPSLKRVRYRVDEDDDDDDNDDDHGQISDDDDEEDTKTNDHGAVFSFDPADADDMPVSTTTATPLSKDANDTVPTPPPPPPPPVATTTAEVSAAPTSSSSSASSKPTTTTTGTVTVSTTRNNFESDLTRVEMQVRTAIGELQAALNHEDTTQQLSKRDQVIGRFSQTLVHVAESLDKLRIEYESFRRTMITNVMDGVERQTFASRSGAASLAALVNLAPAKK